MTRDAPLWALTPETIASLRAHMPNGISTTMRAGIRGIEDIDVYRHSEFMMGMITHEHGGVLRLKPIEFAQLGRIAFPHRESVPWIGY